VEQVSQQVGKRLDLPRLRRSLSRAIFLATWRFIVGAVAAFSLSAAQAAQISVTSGETGASLITVRGELDLTDAIDFMRKTSALKDAVVVLRSPGGNLLAGLQIGRTARQRGFLTVIPSLTNCSSACALAWLGGTPRFMARDSLIGFHAAYFMRGDRPRVSGAANAVVLDYLQELRLPERAVRYVTSAPPDRMSWLTVEAARDLGIEAGVYERGAVFSTLRQPEISSISALKRVESLDLLGFDFPGMPIMGGTAADCEARCETNGGCLAFTFNTNNSACFLKSRAELAVSNPAAISGYRDLPDSQIRHIDMHIQEATDYPGNDIHRQEATTFQACLIACDEEAMCKAFTYIAYRRECWLKNAAGSAEPRDGLVSGIK
jgi:hypothetical protein